MSARDKASDEKLAVTIANAGQRWEWARTAIREHEGTAHEEVASGTTAGS